MWRVTQAYNAAHSCAGLEELEPQHNVCTSCVRQMGSGEAGHVKRCQPDFETPRSLTGPAAVPMAVQIMQHCSTINTLSHP